MTLSLRRIRYLGERLKDWVAQLLKALTSGRGLEEGKLKWRKSLVNPPSYQHPNLLPLEKEQSYLCPLPQVADAPLSLFAKELRTIIFKLSAYWEDKPLTERSRSL
jgi:hypothetical protein